MDKFALSGGIWRWVGALNDNLGDAGFMVVGLFVACWALSVLNYAGAVTTIWRAKLICSGFALRLAGLPGQYCSPAKAFTLQAGKTIGYSVV
ncbi:hypothetical protein MJ575_22850 [Klebsiella pneumoniae]|nr:hypothetical protein MJ575_22850 [Klebsiella pneumoniae]